MVHWRLIALASSLMALGFGGALSFNIMLTILGIVGTWLFVLGAAGYRRGLIPIAIIYSVVFVVSTIYIHDRAFAIAVAIIVYIGLIAASLMFKNICEVMSLKKVNKCINWGGKFIFAGSVAYAFYIGGFIMAIGFMFITCGALRD